MESGSPLVRLPAACTDYRAACAAISGFAGTGAAGLAGVGFFGVIEWTGGMQSSVTVSVIASWPNWWKVSNVA